MARVLTPFHTRGVTFVPGDMVPDENCPDDWFEHGLVGTDEQYDGLRRTLIEQATATPGEKRSSGRKAAAKKASKAAATKAAAKKA